jgi:hypothetical protein
MILLVKKNVLTSGGTDIILEVVEWDKVLAV